MKPVLQALVLAERVFETKSGQMVIAGTFHKVFFARKPEFREVEAPDGTRRRLVAGGLDAGCPFAYISLTDVCQNTELILQFVNLTRNKVLLATGIVVNSTDRLRNMELSVPLPKLPIGEAGAYALEVVWRDEILGSHRIIAEPLEEEE